MTAMLRFGHPPANRFEDFRSPEFRNQKAERVPAGSSICAYVTARACPPFDDARQLQFAQSPIYGGPRSCECLHQFGFARKPLPGLVFTGRNRIGEALANELIFWRWFLHMQADNTGLVFLRQWHLHL